MKKSILIIATMAFAVSASAQIGTALVNQAKDVINAKTGNTQIKVDSAVSKTGKVTDPYLPGVAKGMKDEVKAAIDKKAQAVADFIDGKPAEPAPAAVVAPPKETPKATKTKTTTKKKKKTKK